jgi:type I restriction enzyme R subunit
MLFGECLHNYLIKDAIFDNNVLGFHVEYINTLKGDFDWDDPTTADAIDVGELYLSEERMSLIANHIVQNHKSKTRNGQYTAIFAVSSIEALIKYYDIFKQIKHDLNIAGIFSFGQNEESEGKDEHSRDALERIIDDYNGMYNTNFSTDTFSAYHKDISDRVKGKKTKPLDILIVVNMFLTGFDSKPLQVLYVDKDLKYHDLLQAYSRTNRVEKETKPFGIIICYRNLKKQTDDALTLFSMGHPEAALVPSYEYFVEKFNEMVIKLREIAPTPEAIDTMQDENDQRTFVLTFRELTKYLQSLKTFVEFSFDKDQLLMTEQEHEDYKSKYKALHARITNDRTVVSVLNDVDFCIELMESDRINVAYIMNLIRNIHFDDAEQKDYDIRQIKEELSRTDNPQLLRKVEILQAFLDDVVVALNSADEIDAAYNDFENEEKRKEIAAFAETEDIDSKMLTDIISEYEFSGTLDVGNIRDRIEKPMPLLKKRSLVNRITDFIRKHSEKYE